MSTVRSTPYRLATAAVEAWLFWYTRGLRGTAGEDRRDELTSDLYDQAGWADSVGQPSLVAAVSAFGRLLRGTPADLAWRWETVRNLPAAERTALRQRMSDLRVGGLTVLCGTVMTTWCLFVLWRIAASVDRGDVAPATPASALVLAFAGICLCGTLLAVRDRTRFVGALWLLTASQVILHLGLYALYPSSATVAYLMPMVSGWGIGSVLLSLALGAMCLASAVWHLPIRNPTRASHTTTPERDR